MQLESASLGYDLCRVMLCNISTRGQPIYSSANIWRWYSADVQCNSYCRLCRTPVEVSEEPTTILEEKGRLTFWPFKDLYVYLVSYKVLLWKKTWGPSKRNHKLFFCGGVAGETCCSTLTYTHDSALLLAWSRFRVILTNLVVYFVFACINLPCISAADKKKIRKTDQVSIQ